MSMRRSKPSSASTRSTAIRSRGSIATAARAALGRSILNVGNFATLDQLPRNLAQDPLTTMPKLSPFVPLDLPSVNSLTVRAFNAVNYALHREKSAHTIFDWDSFFYPLDSIRNWPRIYGKRGFVQYQCVWPPDESRAGLVEAARGDHPQPPRVVPRRAQKVRRAGRPALLPDARLHARASTSR